MVIIDLRAPRSTWSRLSPQQSISPRCLWYPGQPFGAFGRLSFQWHRHDPLHRYRRRGRRRHGDYADGECHTRPGRLHPPSLGGAAGSRSAPTHAGDLSRVAGDFLVGRLAAKGEEDQRDRGNDQRRQCERATSAVKRHPPLLVGASAALLLEELLPILHASKCAWSRVLRQDVQALIAVWVQTAVVQTLARAAKSSASLACHARATSVIARCAAILSSTARRR